jgi:hypothetical protein
MKNKRFLNMDERNVQLARRIIAVMYFITILAITGIVLYRQIILGQSIHEFQDIAIVLLFNSVFLITALLYFGAIPVQRLKIKTILFSFATFVILGTLFTYANYNIFQSPGLSARELFGKLIIIFAICGMITIFFIIFSLLGRRRSEKNLEED